MVTVPNVASDTPALRKNPVFMYFETASRSRRRSRRTWPSRSTTRSRRNRHARRARLGRCNEWLPWLAGRLEDVPKELVARRQWLTKERSARISPAVREALAKYYGADAAARCSTRRGLRIREIRAAADDAEIRRCSLL